MEHEDFVTYEQAQKLKELGFDWECNHWYHFLEPDKLIECQTYCNHNKFERPCSAPTLAQVQKWLREVKNIIIQVFCFKPGVFESLSWAFAVVDNDDKELIEDKHMKCFDTYEQALLMGVNKALELIKK